MRRYQIKYTDQTDPMCPVFVTVLSAHSAAHAITKFERRCDPQMGWAILGFQRLGAGQ